MIMEELRHSKVIHVCDQVWADVKNNHYKNIPTMIYCFLITLHFCFTLEKGLLAPVTSHAFPFKTHHYLSVHLRNVHFD